MVLSEYLMISIHTTTQVVTLVRAVLTEVDGISIHTTTQVVTYISFPPPIASFDFNPHHHAGGDGHLSVPCVILQISIHTTTQVVTICSLQSCNVYLISIHTTTQVVTRGTDGLQAPGQFQSTPPRRW